MSKDDGVIGNHLKTKDLDILRDSLLTYLQIRHIVSM